MEETEALLSISLDLLWLISLPSLSPHPPPVISMGILLRSFTVVAKIGDRLSRTQEFMGRLPLSYLIKAWSNK